MSKFFIFIFFIGTVSSFYYYYKNRGWVVFLSYFWLETWRSGAGKWKVESVRVVGKFNFN